MLFRRLKSKSRVSVTKFSSWNVKFQRWLFSPSTQNPALKYAESDGQVRFGDFHGCNDPIFIFASHQLSSQFVFAWLNSRKYRKYGLPIWQSVISFRLILYDLFILLFVITQNQRNIKKVRNKNRIIGSKPGEISKPVKFLIKYR